MLELMVSRGILFKRVISPSRSKVGGFLSTLSLMMLSKEIFRRLLDQAINGVPNNMRFTVPREIFTWAFEFSNSGLLCNTATVLTAIHKGQTQKRRNAISVLGMDRVNFKASCR